jgi:hypothetical protein
VAQKTASSIAAVTPRGQAFHTKTLTGAGISNNALLLRMWRSITGHRVLEGGAQSTHF